MAKKTESFTFDPSKVKVAKQLVYPTLQTTPGVTIYVQPLRPMEEGRRIEDADDGVDRGSKRPPATILYVKVLFAGEGHELNGQDAQIVANKLLVGTLREGYPNDSYVGRKFAITKALAKKKGKGAGDGYYPFQVNEIEEE